MLGKPLNTSLSLLRKNNDERIHRSKTFMYFIFENTVKYQVYFKALWSSTVRHGVLTPKQKNALCIVQCSVCLQLN